MKKINLRQVANVLALLAVIIINGLANSLPLNGQTTGEISDRFNVYFVPAGYVFSIWGLIYLALVAFVVYQALPSQRENPRLMRVGWLFVLSCAANIAWLFFWHYEFFVLSMVAMVALLLLLIAIYERIRPGYASTAAAETWFVRVPFSIYLGWISVATIANASSVLYSLNWGGWGISPEVWTLIMLVVATALTAAMSFTRGDVAYGAVIVWAFAGIAVKHSNTPIVAPATWAATALAAIITALGAFQSRKGRPQEATLRQGGGSS